MRSRTRTLIVAAVAIGGSLLGSYVHAHAAIHRPAPVVYGTQGNMGFADPRARPVTMIEQNGIDTERRITWKTWKATSAVSKRAQERTCGKTCGPWTRVKIRLSRIGYHRAKGCPGGCWYRQPYFRFMTITDTHGQVFCLTFGTGSGTRKPTWYIDKNSLNGC